MRLVMESQMARIGIQTTPAQVSIKQPEADVQIKTTHAKVKIDSELPKVEIDQSVPFAESGLKGIKAFMQESVAYAKQKIQEGTGRASSQGTQMANIHESKNVIADVADDNAWGQFEHEFGLVTMPRTKPDITVIEGKVDIEVEEGKANITVKPNKPEVDYQRGKVEIYVRQQNYLNIDVVDDDRFDMKV